MRHILHGIIDLVYPPVCLLCRTPLGLSEKTEQVCPACQGRLQFNRPPFCLTCSRPLQNPDRPVCRLCRRHPPHFDQSWSALRYDEPLRRLLHQFKYGKKTGLRRFFAQAMFRFLNRYHLPVTPDFLVIPVPLHPRRQSERGYNQSRLLAEMLAPRLFCDIDTRTLLRRLNSPHQAALSAKDRWTNIYGAFTIKFSEAVRGRNVLLIDDLLTTGATVSEAARTLKEAGASEVCVLTLAVTPDPEQAFR